MSKIQTTLPDGTHTLPGGILVVVKDGWAMVTHIPTAVTDEVVEQTFKPYEHPGPNRKQRRRAQALARKTK